MKKSLKDWLIILLYLLDDIAVIAIILVLLRFFNVAYSWPVILTVVFFLGIYAWVMHRMVIPALRKKVTTGSEGIYGQEGKVVKAIAPEGLIKVKGEYWQARSKGETIEVGQIVEVIAIEGLVLIVKAKG